jgi:MoxR-like ATPase
MANQIYKVTDTHRLKLAGPEDIVELLPAPGANPLFLSKNFLDILTYGIAHNEIIHISGPTGSAKSSVLEAFSRAGKLLFTM